MLQLTNLKFLIFKNNVLPILLNKISFTIMSYN